MIVSDPRQWKLDWEVEDITGEVTTLPAHESPTGHAIRNKTEVKMFLHEVERMLRPVVDKRKVQLALSNFDYLSKAVFCGVLASYITHEVDGSFDMFVENDHSRLLFTVRLSDA